MFVTVLSYRARPGEEDAVVALHEDWQRTRRDRAVGFIDGQLFHAAGDPRAFISVVRFESEETAQASAGDRDQDAWYRRLVSLCETDPVLTPCRLAWRSG